MIDGQKTEDYESADLQQFTLDGGATSKEKQPRQTQNAGDHEREDGGQRSIRHERVHEDFEIDQTETNRIRFREIAQAASGKKYFVVVAIVVQPGNVMQPKQQERSRRQDRKQSDGSSRDAPAFTQKIVQDKWQSNLRFQSGCDRQ